MTNETASTQETAPAAPEAPRVAPKAARSSKEASSRKKAATPRKAAKAAKKAGKPAASKKATVLAMLQRKGGATLAEIAKATSWQNHSIRGFISGTVGKRLGLRVESSKNENGDRLYRISK